MRVLLMFCEGPHDVVFVKRIMSTVFSFVKVSWKFSEYPSPFNQLFKQSVEVHAAQDMALDMAHKFFLPDHVLCRQNELVLIFNSGGKSNNEKIKKFLEDLVVLLDSASIFSADAGQVVEEARFMFFYDADSVGFSNVKREVYTSFNFIGEGGWLSEEWEDRSPCGAENGLKALYVWGATPELGTLEDILHPIFAVDNFESMDSAAKYVDSVHAWDVESSDSVKSVAEKSKRMKAIFTVLGQRKKPGASMNVILDQAGLIKDTAFASNEGVRDLARFIANFSSF